MALDLGWVNSSWFERPRGRGSWCESLWAGLPSDAVSVANGEVWAFAAFSRFAQHLLRAVFAVFAAALALPFA